MGSDTYSYDTPDVHHNAVASPITPLPEPIPDPSQQTQSAETIGLLEARIRQLEAQIGKTESEEPTKKNRLTGELKLAVSCNIVSLCAVNTTEESFSAKFVLRARTLNAKEMQVIMQDGSGRQDITADNWEPRLQFMNLTETIGWAMTAKSSNDGEISFKYHISGTFKEKLELQWFPFDIQPLSLVMSSTIPAAESNFTVDGKPTGIQLVNDTQRQSILKLSNFCVASFKPLHICDRYVHLESTLTKEDESSSGTIRPVLTISVVVGRKPGYYVWNIVVPLLVINGISLGSFAVPSSDTADRLSVSMTMVLTLVAFKLQISDKLPDLSYLTLLDQFVLASFFFVGAISVQNIFSSGEVANMSDDSDDDAAWVFVWLYIAGTAFVLLVVFWLAFRIGKPMNFSLRGGKIIPLEPVDE